MVITARPGAYDQTTELRWEPTVTARTPSVSPGGVTDRKENVMVIGLILLGLFLCLVWLPLGVVCFIGAIVAAVVKSNRKHAELIEALRARDQG